MTISWSPQAKENLNDIINFIAKDKKSAALKWAQTLDKKISRLQRFPYSGHVVPEVKRQEIREIIFGAYRIIYKIGKNISILAIFHGAKMLAIAFQLLTDTIVTVKS